MWITKREDLVVAKGKGEMQTYWLRLTTASRAPSIVEKTEGGTEGSGKYEWDTRRSDNIARLVDWNVEMLVQLLKQVVAGRQEASSTSKAFHESVVEKQAGDKKVPLDEVTEIIKLPGFDAKKSQASGAKDVELGEFVESELHEFVSRIAATYLPNPFHNFEHASHVAMSVHKLLSRIVAPDVEMDHGENTQETYASKLHDHTYGITSDPLTQFSVVLSALIHDAAHP